MSETSSSEKPEFCWPSRRGSRTFWVAVAKAGQLRFEAGTGRPREARETGVAYLVLAHRPPLGATRRGLDLRRSQAVNSAGGFDVGEPEQRRSRVLVGSCKEYQAATDRAMGVDNRQRNVRSREKNVGTRKQVREGRRREKKVEVVTIVVSQPRKKKKQQELGSLDWLARQGEARCKATCARGDGGVTNPALLYAVL